MRHHETVVIRCDDIGARCGDVGARCGDVGARCGDVCVWGSDVGDCAEVIRCDDIGARCGDVVARWGDVSAWHGPCVIANLCVDTMAVSDAAIGDSAAAPMPIIA